MLAKLAGLPRFGRSMAGRFAIAATPCNDNQPIRRAIAPRRLRRPLLFSRWRQTPAGALECSWHIETMANADEPGMSRRFGRTAFAAAIA
jgi:hypothetical protein